MLGLRTFIQAELRLLVQIYCDGNMKAMYSVAPLHFIAQLQLGKTMWAEISCVPSDQRQWKFPCTVLWFLSSPAVATEENLFAGIPEHSV